MSSKPSLYRSERGAIFIQVGVLILALMALNVFVVDYGVLWTARGQAQTAADAAALAGATARAYDMRMVLENRIIEVAQKVADSNQIWQAVGGKVVQVDAGCPAGVPRCVTVSVYRDGTFGSAPLPQFFTPLIGVANHGVMATASAIVGPANTTTCLKPWALPDEWREFGSATELPEVDVATAFRAWGMPNPDTFTAPTAAQASTATNFSTDYGDRVAFQFTYAPAYNAAPITRGLMVPLTLPGPNTFAQNMTACHGQPVQIGQRIPLDGTLTHAAALPVAQAVYASDGAADWASEGTNALAYVRDSCAPTCAPISPRTWAIALFDPLDFEENRAMGWPECGGVPCVLVSNIVGFFIDYVEPQPDQHGHFVRYPGTVAAAPLIIEDGSWLAQPRLIR